MLGNSRGARPLALLAVLDRAARLPRLSRFSRLARALRERTRLASARTRSSVASEASGLESLVTCDGTSDLGDFVILANTGQTCEVPLLKGANYVVRADAPLTDVALGDENAHVVSFAPEGFDITYPLDCSFARSGDDYSLTVAPAIPGLTLASLSGGCCALNVTSNGFSWTCADTCTCGGAEQLFEVRATWAGYSRDFSCPLACTCGEDAADPSPVVEPQGGPFAASVAVSFSKDAVIFEDAYENMPGVGVGRRSTASTLTIRVNGGSNGGTLTASATNLGRLQKNAGPAFPVAAVPVPAGRSVTYEMNYVGLEASDAADDVVVTATFAENESLSTPLVSTARLTAVRIEFEAVNAAPANANLHRHVFGILEEFYYRSFPLDATVDWQFFEGEEFLPPFSPGRMILPPTTNETSNGLCELRATSGHACFTNSFQFFLPRIVAGNPRCNEALSPVRGEAGWLLLYLTLHVEPLFVSFKGLQMREIPDESGNCPHAGYYNDTAKGGYLSHCVAAGAGVVNEIRADGYWTTDRCGRGGRYEEPWSDGWKEWPIPVGWGYCNSIMGRYDLPPTTQRFTLRADGTFSIKKFGIEATRDIQNHIVIQSGP